MIFNNTLAGSGMGRASIGPGPAMPRNCGACTAQSPIRVHSTAGWASFKASVYVVRGIPYVCRTLGSKQRPSHRVEQIYLHALAVINENKHSTKGGFGYTAFF